MSFKMPLFYKLGEIQKSISPADALLPLQCATQEKINRITRVGSKNITREKQRVTECKRAQIQKAVLKRTALYINHVRLNYFVDKKSFTLSLCMIASLKVYAPVFGLRTALITLVQFLASAAAFTSFTFAFFDAAFAMLIRLLVYPLSV